ncbi:SUKH-4 family immunity protein [Streptomyces sp. NPDC007100]|uniref:SUKH-4 family immunity protein n=1 Tax=Streptomyces sp. NPDC007100 TaxID=3155602 RepID=UPI0033EDAF2A
MPHKVTIETVVAEVASWWQDDLTWEPAVVEVTGPRRSGRTAALLRVADELPEAVVLDAEGLTAEELHAAVREAGEIDWVAAKEGDWSADDDRDEERKLILILNGQRAGRTRLSSHPGRILDSNLDDLAETGALGIVIEADADDSAQRAPYLPRTRHLLPGPARPSASSETGPESGATHSPELRALALAEMREVPIAVWRELSRACGAGDRTADDLIAFAQSHDALEVLPSGVVRFHREADAEELRGAEESATGQQPGAVHRAIMQWLLDEFAGSSYPQGWQAAGDIGAYAAQALPAHAVHAGEFDRFVADGRLVANVAQDALLDAGSCLAEGAPGDSVVSDAFFAHLHGVMPSSQGEWSAWLHLMATARGDEALAEAIENSGVRMPWKVRWTDWRPPGGFQARFTEPGSIVSLGVVCQRDEPLLVGFGQYDRTLRSWRAETGERAYPQFTEEFPQDVADTLSWPDGRTAPLTAQALRKASLPSALNGLNEDLLSCSTKVGGLIVLGGPGGVIAIEPTDAPSSSSAPLPLSPLRDQREVWEYDAAGPSSPVPAGPLDRAMLDELYGPDFTRDLHAAQLPEELRSVEARRVLTDIGIPPVNVVGLKLDVLGEGSLTSVPWPADAPAPGGSGPFFRIGQWWGGTVVIDGSNGEVLRSPADDEPAGWSRDCIVAADLERFVTMVYFFTIGAHMLSLNRNRLEGILLRARIQGGLESLDDTGGRSPAWTYGL